MTLDLDLEGVFRDGGVLWAAFFASLIVSRLIEYGLVRAHHSLDVALWKHELVGGLHDLEFSLFVAVGIIGGYLTLFSIAGRSVAFGVTLAGLVVLIVGHLVLIRYYTTTLQPLGLDFWAYDLTEVVDTVQTSGAGNVVFWGNALVLIAVLVGNAFFLRAGGVPDKALYAVGILALLNLFVSTSALDADRPAAEHLALNKTAYFLGESAAWAFASSSTEYQPKTEPTDNVASADASVRSREYPWMYRANYEDVLGPFFDQAKLDALDRPPHVVVIVFEGLGTTFIGEEARYGGMTPFVDSLARDGLYWKNFLSTTGRTFGLMPSLFGALPFAERGFMAMGDDMPRHQTLIRLLGERGYHTSYYSGFDTAFDNVDQFLKRQEIDRLVDRSELHRRFGGDPGATERYWGYPDKEMFSLATSIIDTVDRQPRLDIFHTLQSHDPFVVPEEEDYWRRFEQRLQALNLSEDEAARYRTYQSELTTLLYTDDALRQFFEWYQSQPAYENTIFMITGDHRLIPIPQPTQIARYHVPFLLYSPLLAESATFASVSSHADVGPTLLGFLQAQFGLSWPETAHWLGTRIDTARQFRNVHSRPLMRNKNQLIDYLHKDYYQADDQLYRLSEGMALTPVNNPDKQADLEQRMARFKRVNQYVTQQNKLYSPEVPGHELPPTTPYRAASAPDGPASPQQAIDTVLARIDEQDLNTTEQFQVARRKAFDGDYAVARALCRRLLQTSPDYHDVRTLLGRTYAWTQQFDTARDHFRTILQRNPAYYDAYNALADVELWAGRPRAALETINAGLDRHPDRADFLAKKAKALLALNRSADATQVVATLEQTAPDYDELPTLKNRLHP
ncbi:hypothetical protein BSZ35_09595 [Salinibacter sp. 10B]|uniref:sulfatase-like hydrolase/transferase n=1 Tax=Salinibacter sp. 10B TaxID=1923971 RepID=UPI000CF5719B|nr:sulfatase-like hydrolase/transferase [Salinibacter sp. 10B]PQJ34822.1 hypothetical protein BSZ35_09595 [Salinibacter sp. 10B]